MATKPRVAVLRVTPETILDDIDRLLDLAGVRQAMDPSATTILKDNISWHFPFPAANTTPWQLEGTILALRKAGFADLAAVQNKTVVTNAFKGEDLNHYVPIFRRYGVPVLYNFRDEDMKWIEYRPKAKMLVLDKIYPEGIRIPDYFVGKNIVHLPTTKCVAGDTEIIRGDGTRATIRDLFQQAVAAGGVVEVDGDLRCRTQVSVLAMDAQGRIRPFRASWLWRTQRQARKVLALRTRSGRTVLATEDHLFWTPQGWRRLGNLAAGEHVAIGRHLDVRGRSQPLPQTHAAIQPFPKKARAGRKYSEEFCQEILDRYAVGETVTAIASAKNIRWQTVQSILRRHEVVLRRNVARPRIPRSTSSEFWRWIGYFIAEGCIEQGARGSYKLWWSNCDPRIRHDFTHLSTDLFGMTPKAHRSNPGMHIYSRNLALFLGELGLPLPLKANNKQVPEHLFRCPDDQVASFLSAYLDGDGFVSSRQAEVTATTKSRRLAMDLQVLFARLGAVAFGREILQALPGWSAPRTYYQVSVRGESMARLQRHLHLRHPRKANRFEDQAKRFLSGKRQTTWDVVPLDPGSVRGVREGLRMTQAATGVSSSINMVENAHGRPTPRVALTILESLARHDKNSRFSDTLADMNALASPDLAWDSVAEVREIDGSQIDLYDLTVPEAESFVGNGLVLHNCHIYTTTTGAMKNAFGGLLNTKRHYTHSWIHATLVDLLAIQKEIHPGLFAVVDGTTAGNGPGPRTMFPVVKNFMLASADQVAVDAVSAKMMGFDPMSIDYIRLGHESGLGVGRTTEIEVVGVDVSQENWGFRVGDNGASRVGDLLWFGPLRGVQNFFFRTPLVNLFILGSEAYHDFYRWPARDRRVFERWLRETGWGHLFAAYAGGEPVTAGGATSSARS